MSSKNAVSAPKLRLTFRQIESTDAIKNYADKKVAKLLPLLRDKRSFNMILGTDNISQYAELEILDGQNRYFARADENDLYASIDALIEKIARQIKDQQDKTRDLRRSNGAKTKREQTP